MPVSKAGTREKPVISDNSSKSVKYMLIYIGLDFLVVDV